MSTVLDQIEQQIAKLSSKAVKKNTGKIRTVADGVAKIDGLSEVMYNEMVQFPGGAIGIALIDTVLYGRAPVLGERLVAQMKAGSAEAAAFVGIPLDDFATLSGGSMDIEALGELQDRVEKAALTLAVNEAWLMLTAITLAALLALVAARRPSA